MKSIEVPLPPQLGEVLTDTDNRERLTERALETPLHDLGNFLGYAARTDVLKPVFKALTGSLRSDQNLRKLSAIMARASLSGIVSVMRTNSSTDLWHAAFSQIDLELWNQSMCEAENQTLDAFVAFQRIAFEQNRIELNHTPALILAERSTAAEWQRPGIGLHHLSHVVRLAVGASSDQIDAFLARVATSEWLDGLYGSVSVGYLASALFSFGTHLGRQRSAVLCRPSLSKRLRSELQPGGKRKPELDAQAIALLGACKTIGITISEKPHIRSSLRALLRIRKLSPNRTTIGTIQIQFWLGLRELARLRRDAPPVPPELAQPILDLWIATAASEVGAGLPPPARKLNAEMISWLEQCRTAGWRLVPPDDEFGSGSDQPER